ncbi:MAG: tripartite tricarboxylate transporter substrate binding protein [Xanthobacteraceae bacterium]|nr:tripartite tricarboxylate transporter substrate binding protein [Xanthobacteraceae bacterium]
MRIRALLGSAIILSSLALSALPAAAQNWPQRPVRFILPLGPGSGVDISARLIADKLSAKWGQPVVVENRPGGDGIVAISAFTGTRDDHVLLMSPTSSFTAHPYLHEKLPYDARDLAPIARISNTVVGVVVPSSSDIKTVKELVDTARANPGKLNWATITGMFDFVFAGFQKKMGIEIAKVPYRDTVQAVNDLAEGRIQIMMSAIAIVRPRVQAGAIRMIAVTASERASIAPDVPTTTEAGFPDIRIDGLTGLFGTRDMPADLRERIAADVKAAAADPAISSRLLATGQVVNPGGPAEFGAAIDAQRAQVAATGQLLGIKPASN